MGSIEPSQKESRRVYLLTAPRTASNLFVKILNIYKQPNAVVNDYHGGYFFMPAFFKRDATGQWDKPLDALTAEETEEVRKDIQEGADHLRGMTESAGKDGKIMFVKEHVHLMTKSTLLNEFIHGIPAESTPSPFTINMYPEHDIHTAANPTFLPDNWFHTFSPTFLIRHPAMQVPSMYRALVETRGAFDTPSKKAMFKYTLTLRGTRKMFDFYDSHFHSIDPSSPWPLLIDGGEFITHPEPIMKHFCDMSGFDFNKCQFNWDKASKEKLESLRSKPDGRFLSTLNGSTGIRKDKANPDVDIDVEANKWRQEFGDEVGNMLEEAVRHCMPDYQHMYARRWTPIRKDSGVEFTNGVRSTVHNESPSQVEASV